MNIGAIPHTAAEAILSLKTSSVARIANMLVIFSRSVFPRLNLAAIPSNADMDSKDAVKIMLPLSPRERMLLIAIAAKECIPASLLPQNVVLPF